MDYPLIPNFSPLILVTDATGYVGGRLVPRLLERDYRVRCLVRDPARLRQRPWANWFDSFAIILEADGKTLLSGTVPDQSALYGLLRKVRLAYE